MGKAIFYSRSLRLKYFELKINNENSIIMQPTYRLKTSTQNHDAEEKQHCH